VHSGEKMQPAKPEGRKYSVNVGGTPIEFETGRLAQQAGGAVTLHMEDTLLFAAATMSAEVRAGINFFPLTVDFEERMYAGGRIPGSFFRREGRPTEEAILTARLTDRPLRPLFPKDLRNDVQVIIYALSTASENPMDVLAVNVASAALMVSDVPWDGPVAAVRVGRIDGQFVVNPTYSDLESSDLDLRLAGTRDAILMVESSANEVGEDVMVAALEFGHNAILPIIEIQERMAAEIGKPKREYTSFAADESLEETIFERVRQPMNDLLDQPYEKAELYNAIDELRDGLVADLAPEDDEVEIRKVKDAFEAAEKRVVRRRILEKKLRPDGRNLTEIRPIWCEVDVSPRAHGSGLFTRGETQVLTLATLGTPREAQELDNLSPSESKRYIHHYNFPPFSTGEP
jgi:polyribonucleotide nucleotidyltransferase